MTYPSVDSNWPFFDLGPHGPGKKGSGRGMALYSHLAHLESGVISNPRCNCQLYREFDKLDMLPLSCEKVWSTGPLSRDIT